jgi:hypothetical protein
MPPSNSPEDRSLRRSLLTGRQQHRHRSITDSRATRDQAYGDRTPTYRPGQQQSVYDWAPANDMSELSRISDQRLINFVEDIGDYLNDPRASIPPDYSLPSEARHRAHTSRSSDRSPLTTDSSLRSLVFMQSIRRHPRLVARAGRNLSHSMYMERERSLQDSTPEGDTPRPPTRHNTGEDLLPSGLEASMVRYITERAARQERRAGTSARIEQAIIYLERLRHSNSMIETEEYAKAGGLLEPKFVDSIGSFICEAAALEPVQGSSWLRVGATFVGSQFADHSEVEALRRSAADELRLAQAARRSTSEETLVEAAARRVSEQARRLEETARRLTEEYSQPDLPGRSISRDPTVVEQINPHFVEAPAPLIRPRGYRDDNLLYTEESVPAALPQETIRNTQGQPNDHWEVKVTIHSIDYTRMRLTGTMEAVNVPDRLSASGKSSIITYLEGEIIDLKSYSLQTISFDSTAANDGRYWRRLEPFLGMDDMTLARNLLDQNWLEQELQAKWILMRWKGRILMLKLC